LDEVDFLEVFDVRWLEYVEDRDYVFMIEVAKQLDLAQGAQTEHRVVKGRNAFDGHFALRWYMDCGTVSRDKVSQEGRVGGDNGIRLPYNAIGTLTDDV
jgi:hypothetical protein